ncbi:PP0621 family protein [Sulfurimonas sp. HSL-1716]|uniref:PP0621 family protein n=1 Tax=Hydrocurvibacter sulfurireducens TaxID=3131937 RepID=UPI0031FA4693
MLKYLVVIGVIAVVYYFFIKKTPPVSSSNKKSGTQKLEDNDMVACSECGIYTEVNEAILSNGKYYCSKECLKDSQ